MISVYVCIRWDSFLGFFWGGLVFQTFIYLTLVFHVCVCIYIYITYIYNTSHTSQYLTVGQ